MPLVTGSERNKRNPLFLVPLCPRYSRDLAGWSGGGLNRLGPRGTLCKTQVLVRTGRRSCSRGRLGSLLCCFQVTWLGGPSDRSEWLKWLGQGREASSGGPYSKETVTPTALVQRSLEVVRCSAAVESCHCLNQLGKLRSQGSHASGSQQAQGLTCSEEVILRAVAFGLSQCSFECPFHKDLHSANEID